MRVIWEKRRFDNLQDQKLEILDDYTVSYRDSEDRIVNLFQTTPWFEKMTVEHSNSVVSVYSHLDFDKLENSIRFGSPIQNRDQIFTYLEKYLHQYHCRCEKNLTFRKLIQEIHNLADWAPQQETTKHYQYLPLPLTYINGIIFDLHYGRFYLEQPWQTLTLNGGILIDEYQYNKSKTLVQTCFANRDLTQTYLQTDQMIYDNRYLVTNATLIICPDHLIKHWTKTIGTEHPYLTIYSKKYHDRYTYQDCIDAEFVIVSCAYLQNKHYRQLWKNYKLRDQVQLHDCIESMCLELMRNPELLGMTNPFLSCFYWRRMIVDECPEILAGQAYYLDLVRETKAISRWYLDNREPESNTELLHVLGVVVQSKDRIFEPGTSRPVIYNNVGNVVDPASIVRGVICYHRMADVSEVGEVREDIKMIDFSPMEQMLYQSYSQHHDMDHDIDYLYTYIYSKILSDIYGTLQNCKTLTEVRNGIIQMNQDNINKGQKIKKVLLDNIRDYQRRRVIARNENFNQYVIEDLDKKIAETNKSLQQVNEQIKESETNLTYSERLLQITSLSDSDTEIEMEFQFDLQTEPDERELEFEDLDLERCSICLGNIEEDNFGITICGHIFCFFCITESLTHKQECPYCRKKLGHSDVFKIINRKRPARSFDDMDLPKHPSPKMVSRSLGSALDRPSSPVPNIEYLNAYTCEDTSWLVEKYGSKYGQLIRYLQGQSQKVVIYTRLGQECLANLGHVLDQEGIQNLVCDGTKHQKNRIIDRFNASKNNLVLILPWVNLNLAVLLQQVSHIIYLEPMTGSKEQIRKMENQSLGCAYHNGDIDEMNIVRFVTRNTIEEDVFNQHD